MRRCWVSCGVPHFLDISNHYHIILLRREKTCLFESMRKQRRRSAAQQLCNWIEPLFTLHDPSSSYMRNLKLLTIFCGSTGSCQPWSDTPKTRGDNVTIKC